MRKQSDEEREHALLLMQFQNMRGGTVKLEAVAVSFQFLSDFSFCFSFKFASCRFILFEVFFSWSSKFSVPLSLKTASIEGGRDRRAALFEAIG